MNGPGTEGPRRLLDYLWTPISEVVAHSSFLLWLPHLVINIMGFEVAKKSSLNQFYLKGKKTV